MIELDQCTHEVQEVRRRTYSNGVTHCVIQCLDCGLNVRSVPKISIPDLDALEWWDEALVERRHKERDRAFQHQREERRERHAEYLASSEWWERRSMRMDMDSFVCQARLPGCFITATEVHHHTYRFWGNEPLFDLVSVCRHCHEQISLMEGRVNQLEVND